METRLVTYRSANFERAFTSTDGARVIVEFIDIFFPFCHGHFHKQMVPWCLFCSLIYFQSGQTETFLLIFGALALSMVTRLATYR